MKKLGLHEIRKAYLDFFESKGHLVAPSFPLVPQNDKSLLLINAGMAPLKSYFAGTETPPRTRMATCQKCVRTPDIERVGKTARHGTFFEMLGNFSFGDYFKKEAIEWAWEFSIKCLGLPEEKIHISVYLEDDEAFDIWHKHIGIPKERITRLGKEDNFWEIGVGPCGPCSELYFDRGIEFGCQKETCGVGCDCDRFMEYWNLVFTQFDKDESGTYHRLPKPNIDTGMGLERIAAIIQGVKSVFEVDTIRPILDYVCELTSSSYGKDDKSDMSIRVITDHVRNITFMIGDGVIPSNEGRGYVLRRLLRRAARHQKLLGLNTPNLHKVANIVIDLYGNDYPELKEKREYIGKIIKIEEDRFEETIDQGMIILNGEIEKLKENGRDILSGDTAFKLYDTYGFPLDLTKDVLEEKGLRVDEEGFNKEMKEQRERARAARQDMGDFGWENNFGTNLGDDLITVFEGYSNTELKAKVLAIYKDGEPTDRAIEGEEINLIIDKTPFYPEGGGQIADKGIIISNSGRIEVLDCKKFSDKIIHVCKVVEGYVTKDDIVEAKVRIDKRKATYRNHTTTHLLHKALREVLGDHIQQSGSLVTDQRLRFDFTHFTGLTQEEIERVEEIVNEKILDNIDVEAIETDISTAKNMGATALFGEKYGDKVRVVKVGDYSMELCGGTHASSTGEIGSFVILSEGGIAAGIRRIEAVTGKAAIQYLKSKKERLKHIASLLKTNEEDVENRIEGLSKESKDKDKEIAALKTKLAAGAISSVIQQAITIGNTKVVVQKFGDMDSDGLRTMGDLLKEKLDNGVAVIAGIQEDKLNFVATATKDAVKDGIHCGNIIKEVAKLAGGGGGGRPDMAQAGGKEVAKVEEALSIVQSLVSKQLGL